MDADAIVIGAGAAGLSAALTLADRSLRVIVLEARDRIGGRVWSQPLARGPAVELGAEFIHGTAAETRALLQRCGSTWIESIGESWSSCDGRLRRDDEDFDSAAHLFGAVESLADDETVERFLARFSGNATTAAAAQRALQLVEGFDAIEPAVASVRAIAAEWKSGVDSLTARPRTGYAPMFAYLHDVLSAAGVHFQLSSVVRCVGREPGKVSIDIDTGSGHSRTLRARVAIVTLPIGVLRYRGQRCAVRFEPALPPAAEEALNHIEMGHAVRIGLVFAKPFWEALENGRYRNAAFFRTVDQPFSAFWTQFPISTSVLVAWAGGPKAIALRSRSESQRAALALEVAAGLFGCPALVREQCTGFITHDWSADPFARGAYSYVAVGGDSARASLAHPIDGALYFAGEATAGDGQGGTVNGALRSGTNAALRAAATLGVANPDDDKADAAC